MESCIVFFVAHDIFGQSKKEGKDQESINQVPHLTKDTNGTVTASH